MAKLFDGKVRHDDGYSYQAIDMCLASEPWQASRVKAFNALADVGFKVVQLDEFPIAPVWHVSPCGAKNHLHLPADQTDEWEKSIAFIAKLAAHAENRDVFLTTEEPSAALLPYTAGYIDRQYNDSIDIYGAWKKSASIQTTPIFSTMFSDLVTPYTDVDGTDPAHNAPEGWLRAHKVSQ